MARILGSTESKFGYTRPRSAPRSNRINFRACTRCAWCGANYPSSAPLPPLAQRIVFHEGVIKALLSERVAERCERANIRGIKRRMSNWPLRRARVDSDKSLSWVNRTLYAAPHMQSAGV